MIGKLKGDFVMDSIPRLSHLSLYFRSFTIALLCIVSVVSALPVRAETPISSPSLFQLTLSRIDGTKVPMTQFEGKVILVVNTASKCGFTPQYKDLEVLYERYRQRGFVVLGFPSNDFRNQEPGPDDEIAKFCKAKFGVTFPLFKKGPVTGSQMQPFYRTLLSQASDEFSTPPAWNFEKIILDRAGKVVARFGSFVNPLSDRITSVIEKEIAPPVQSKAR
jgi:glutathione peroxidase